MANLEKTTGFYDFSNEMEKITSKELKRATQAINKELTVGMRSQFKIAAILANVEATAAYEKDGYKSAVDYAMKMFGYKKSQAYNFVRVGEIFLDSQGNITNPDLNGSTFTDLVKMLPSRRAEKEDNVESAGISDSDERGGGSENTVVSAKVIEYKIDYSGTILEFDSWREASKWIKEFFECNGTLHIK